MVNKETLFMKQLEHGIRRLMPTAIWQRHTDRFFVGVSDVEVVYADPPHQLGVTSWMEVKWLTGRKLKGNSSGQLQPLQELYLKQRVSRGVNAFVIYGYKDKQGLLHAVAYRGDEVPDELDGNEHGMINKVGSWWDLRPWLSYRWA